MVDQYEVDTSQVSNPVIDEYPGRKELLDIHTGFSLYMLRRRKDTQMNKIEEIMEKIDSIGREMVSDGSLNFLLPVIHGGSTCNFTW